MMRKLLLLKLGAIGDVIMTLPAARLMYEAGYEIDWVVSEAVAPVLQKYAWIKVLPVDEHALLRSGKWRSVQSLITLWKELFRRGTYDLCATLYYDRRYRLLSLPVRAHRKLMLSHADRSRRLLSGRHHTDEYARILLGRSDEEAPHQLAPVPAEGLPEPRFPATGERPRIVLVPGGARNLMRDDALRRWPTGSYVELATQLLQCGFEVVLLGGPGDAWASLAFEALETLDLIGQLSLIESLALLQSADVTVTHDTGPLHMAGMTRTSIVALFGPTSPYTFCPQRENVIALWGGEGFACRPCYDGRDYAPCSHNGCLHQVTVALALEAVQRLLEAAREGRTLPPQVEVPPHTSVVQGAVHMTQIEGARP